MVRVTHSGTKYHRAGCSEIEGFSTKSVTMKEAKMNGYTACRRCRPQ